MTHNNLFRTDNYRMVLIAGRSLNPVVLIAERYCTEVLL